MVVLGIAGNRRDAAAALVADGRLAAAVTEETVARAVRASYARPDGFPSAAIEACLARAGLTAADVDAIVCADAGEATAGAPYAAASGLPVGASGAARPHTIPRRPIAALWAHAIHAAAYAPEDPSLILVADREAGGGLVALRRDGRAAPLAPVHGMGALFAASRRVALEIGLDGEDADARFDSAAALGEPEYAAAFERAIRCDPAAGIEIDQGALRAILASAAASCHGALADAESGNIRVQERRRAIAASCQARFTTVLCAIAEHACKRTGTDALAMAGSAFASAPFNTRLFGVFGDSMRLAPVPEPPGRAVGAAFALTRRLDGRAAAPVALGPEFGETQIKGALDNCRLDYVYEPDWKRLLARVSDMLARGKTVAWFQGPMDFGPRSLGSRSVLCDPSNRYARENINCFLKQRQEDCPIAVSLTPEAAAECLSGPCDSPFMLLEATVRAGWRDRLRAALNHRQAFPVHVARRDQHPEFSDLLDLHRERTGIPGLLHTTLSGPDEPTACTPRDAIRTTYSTAIDALVMGRFLVMKDYWLLRSDLE